MFCPDFPNDRRSPRTSLQLGTPPPRMFSSLWECFLCDLQSLSTCLRRMALAGRQVKTRTAIASLSFRVHKLYIRMPYGIPVGCTHSLPASHCTPPVIQSTCTLPSPALYCPLYCTPCRAVPCTVPCCHVHRLICAMKRVCRQGFARMDV